MPIEYRTVRPDKISPGFFEGFDRTQHVSRCWRKIDGQWMLKDIAFTERWIQTNYAQLTQEMTETVRTGGAVLAAFQGGRLVGFGSVEATALGSRGQYRQLSQLHVSAQCRGQGVGTQLFRRLAACAVTLGGEKLYISGHSSQETQAFYKRMGCVETEEYDQRLLELEPCDCHLEYVL